MQADHKIALLAATVSAVVSAIVTVLTTSVIDALKHKPAPRLVYLYYCCGTLLPDDVEYFPWGPRKSAIIVANLGDAPCQDVSIGTAIEHRIEKETILASANGVVFDYELADGQPGKKAEVDIAAIVLPLLAPGKSVAFMFTEHMAGTSDMSDGAMPPGLISDRTGPGINLADAPADLGKLTKLVEASHSFDFSVPEITNLPSCAYTCDSSGWILRKRHKIWDELRRKRGPRPWKEGKGFVDP